MPESSRSSKINHWSALAAGESADLRRRFNRDAEAVITDIRIPPVATNPSLSGFSAAEESPSKLTKSPRIPQCFNSYNACTNRTDNCSGHGKCVNKYGKRGNASAVAEDAKTCFVCACERTVVDPGKGETHIGIKTISWGGNMCQKKDVSVPFWLLAGFTVTLVGAMTFAIGLLYSVGNEPLPGVIGAGVIRSAK